MKIIILGAGQVGGTVAANLTNEDNDITVVDRDASILQGLQDRLDLRTIVGSATYPEVLERAGADDADMVIAVTKKTTRAKTQSHSGAEFGNTASGTSK